MISANWSGAESWSQSSKTSYLEVVALAKASRIPSSNRVLWSDRSPLKPASAVVGHSWFMKDLWVGTTSSAKNCAHAPSQREKWWLVIFNGCLMVVNPWRVLMFFFVNDGFWMLLMLYDGWEICGSPPNVATWPYTACASLVNLSKVDITNVGTSKPHRTLIIALCRTLNLKATAKSAGRKPVSGVSDFLSNK